MSGSAWFYIAPERRAEIIAVSDAKQYVGKSRIGEAVGPKCYTPLCYTNGETKSCKRGGTPLYHAPQKPSRTKSYDWGGVPSLWNTADISTAETTHVWFGETVVTQGTSPERFTADRNHGTSKGAGQAQYILERIEKHLLQSVADDVRLDAFGKEVVSTWDRISALALVGKALCTLKGDAKVVRDVCNTTQVKVLWQSSADGDRYNYVNANPALTLSNLTYADANHFTYYEQAKKAAVIKAELERSNPTKPEFEVTRWVPRIGPDTEDESQEWGSDRYVYTTWLPKSAWFADTVEAMRTRLKASAKRMQGNATLDPLRFVSDALSGVVCEANVLYESDDSKGDYPQNKFVARNRQSTEYKDKKHYLSKCEGKVFFPPPFWTRVEKTKPCEAISVAFPTSRLWKHNEGASPLLHEASTVRDLNIVRVGTAESCGNVVELQNYSSACCSFGCKFENTVPMSEEKMELHELKEHGTTCRFCNAMWGRPLNVFSSLWALNRHCHEEHLEAFMDSHKGTDNKSYDYRLLTVQHNVYGDVLFLRTRLGDPTKAWVVKKKKQTVSAAELARTAKRVLQLGKLPTFRGGLVLAEKGKALNVAVSSLSFDGEAFVPPAVKHYVPTIAPYRAEEQEPKRSDMLSYFLHEMVVQQGMEEDDALKLFWRERQTCAEASNTLTEDIYLAVDELERHRSACRKLRTEIVGETTQEGRRWVLNIQTTKAASRVIPISLGVIGASDRESNPSRGEVLKHCATKAKKAQQIMLGKFTNKEIKNLVIQSKKKAVPVKALRKKAKLDAAMEWFVWIIKWNLAHLHVKGAWAMDDAALDPKNRIPSSRNITLPLKTVEQREQEMLEALAQEEEAAGDETAVWLSGVESSAAPDAARVVEVEAEPQDGEDTAEEPEENLPQDSEAEDEE